jgi:hypothetical protein
MKKQIILFLAIAVLLFSCQPKQTSTEEASLPKEPVAPTIVGAWEIIEASFSNKDTSGVFTPFRSIIIYTDNFYSREIALRDRPSWPDIPDDEEVAYEDLSNAYSYLIANSGRYEIRGDSIFHDVIISKSPNFMNKNLKLACAFKLDGDQLTTNSTRSSGANTIYTHRRLR